MSKLKHKHITEHNKYYAIRLVDDSIGILQFRHDYLLLKDNHKIKWYRVFNDFENAQLGLISYITLCEYEKHDYIELSDYNIDDITKSKGKVMKLNRFYINNSAIESNKRVTRTITVLDVLFDRYKSAKKQCMLKDPIVKVSKNDYYALITKDFNLIGIFNYNIRYYLLDYMTNNVIIKRFTYYKEADTFIRKLIPINEWNDFNLDVGYLKINNLLKRGKNDYEYLQRYLKPDDLNYSSNKKNNSDFSELDGVNINWNHINRVPDKVPLTTIKTNEFIYIRPEKYYDQVPNKPKNKKNDSYFDDNGDYIIDISIDD